MKALLLAAIAGMSLAGCSAECADPSRIGGVYNIFSSVGDPMDPPEGMRPHAAFYNGPRTWNIAYNRNANTVTLLIEGQELTAAYSEDAANCNRFDLEITDGAWSSDATELVDEETITSNHSVHWLASLVWQGDEISGSYSVSDNWIVNGSASGEVASGTLDATGYIAGVRQSD